MNLPASPERHLMPMLDAGTAARWGTRSMPHQAGSPCLTRTVKCSGDLPLSPLCPARGGPLEMKPDWLGMSDRLGKRRMTSCSAGW